METAIAEAKFKFINQWMHLDPKEKKIKCWGKSAEVAILILLQ
jgi:hypothetical protein